MSDKHIEELEPDKSHDKGCVTKHQDKFKEGDRCSYRGNGYQEMKSARKALYQIDFTKDEHARRLPRIYQEYKIGHEKVEANLRSAVNPKKKKEAWWFSNADNYKCAYLPFNHNYHHILPFTALQTLSFDELKIVQFSEYNLNGPKNMIILPCLDAYGIAMMLPSHPYGHVKYNKATKQIVNEIKRDVAGKKPGHEIDKKNVENFRKKIESWQERQFNELVKEGKRLAKNESPYSPPPNQVNQTPIASSS